KTDRKPSVVEEFLVNGWSLRVEDSSTIQPRPNGGTVGIMRRQRQLWSMGWKTVKRNTSSCVIRRTMMPDAAEIEAVVQVLVRGYDRGDGCRVCEGLLVDQEDSGPRYDRVSNVGGTWWVWVAASFLLALDTRGMKEDAA